MRTFKYSTANCEKIFFSIKIWNLLQKCDWENVFFVWWPLHQSIIKFYKRLQLCTVYTVYNNTPISNQNQFIIIILRIENNIFVLQRNQQPGQNYKMWKPKKKIVRKRNIQKWNGRILIWSIEKLFKIAMLFYKEMRIKV